MSPGRTPGQELLLAALRGRSATGDWQAAIDAAPTRLLPYLLDRLERNSLVRSLPPDLRERLVVARRRSAVASLVRSAALRNALAALEQAGVPVVVLKGAALASQVYPDAALRPMQDLDLWVPPERLTVAAAALIGAGFRFPDRTTAGRQLPVAEGLATVLSLELPGTALLVELHGRVQSLEVLSAERVACMWERAVPAEFGAVSGLVLRHDDQLLHLCLHSARSNGFNTGLAALLDIALVLERWQDRWDGAAMAADYREQGIATWMRLTLHLVRDLLGAPVPQAYFDAASAPADLAELEALALEQIWVPDAGLPAALTHLLGDLTWRERVRWLRERLRVYLWPGSATAHGSGSGRLAAGRRFAFDLRTKLPRYFRLWDRRRSGPSLQRRIVLARNRHRLNELVARAESQRAGPAIA